MTRNLDFAVVGNCAVAALIDARGRYVWCGYPRLDSDPVFCSLLRGGADEDVGFFDVAVENPADSDQRYTRNSAILVTTLADQAGNSLRITDFAPRYKRHGEIIRPAVFVRKIEPVDGHCILRVRARPRFGYGAETPERSMGQDWIRFAGSQASLRITTDMPITYLAEERAFALAKPVHLVLGPDHDAPEPIIATASLDLERTQEYWQEWARYLSVPFEWQEPVLRAAVALKLCSFEETGAIVAALTTSIPEAPDTMRNWDYRYCWIRDSNFVVQALNRLGTTRTMEDYIRYVTNLVALERGGTLRPVYPVVPDGSMTEHVAPHLPGFRGMGPVRIGNAAALQEQHDVYGSVVLAAAQMFFDERLPVPGDARLFRLLENLGDRAVERAFRPDAGLWEYRGRSRVHTFSAVMCWAACDGLARIATRLGHDDRSRHWGTEADAIRTRILAEAWNPERGSFVESFGGTEVDASLLLLGQLGFIGYSDRRFVSTVERIERDLRHGDLLFRYGFADDFGRPKTAFTICTFWFIEAIAAIGRREEARQLFERVLAYRNHVGLLAEDIDPETGELWGNFPQSYSMVGLITCAMRLSRTWEQGIWHGS